MGGDRVFSCLLPAVGCALLLAGCKPAAPPAAPIRPARVMRVGDAAVLIGRKFPGRSKATQQVNLSFRVAGPLVSLPVLVGDEVKAGQAVARLDPRDYEVSVSSAQASLGEAKAGLELAKEELRRAQDAFDKGAATEMEVAQKRAAEDGAAATVASAQAALDHAQDDLGYTTVAAPFDGTVTARFVENFEDVQAKAPVLRIVDDSRIEMVVDIPEQIMALTADVAEIRCAFDAFPGRELKATIKERGTEADPVTRTYPVTLIMDQPADVRILPGMTGQAWAVRQRPLPGEESRVEVPLSAVGEDSDGRKFVWAVDETGIVSRRPVEVLDLTNIGVYVRGLEKDELVATAGAAYLHEGQRVRPELIGAGAAAR